MIKLSTLCCFVFLFAALSVQAQNRKSGIITGKLTDTTTHQKLREATLTVFDEKDSSVVENGLSKDDGTFIIQDIPFGQHTLFISFQGYETIKIKFTVNKDTPIVVLSNIYMQLQAHDLSDVTVRAAPIIINKDTVEYNASMFSTKPDATVEDLLKKLPGVEVDKNGNIKAQGETVQRVTVDGKRFFGDDPKMATENLPPDVVDKIQVFDALSDQSAFTGFDDGNRVKTINIVTKKDKRKGYFGKASAGAGNKDLYEGGLSLSKFNGNQQLTVIGQANNTNQQAFTVQDILGSFNSGGSGRGGGYAGGQGGGGGGRGNSASTGGGATRSFVQGVAGSNNSNGGITTTFAGGLNYRDSWGKKTDAYGSYFYNNLQLDKEQNSLTQNLIPGDSSTFNNEMDLSNSRNINQRFNFNIETQFDSSNSLIIRPNGSYQNTTNSSQSTTDITKGKFTDLSNSVATADKQNEGYNGTVDVLFRHRFHKAGRTFSLDVNGGGNSNDGTGDNYSVVTDTLSADTTNQHYIIKSNGQQISTTLSYTEPVGKNQLIEFNYNNSYNKSISDYTTYNYDSSTHDYTQIDTALTNAYENTYTSNRMTLSYLIRNNKLNLSIGSGVQFGKLNSYNKTTDSTLTQQFTNIYPTANFNYRFSRTKNLRINYSGRTTQPNVQQLQPVTDNSDPLNIKLGNPDLKQEFSNNFRLLYTSFDNVHFRNVFASINASFIRNDIVNATTLLSNGAQILQPVNLNGAYSLSGFFNYGFPLKKPASNLNFTTNLSFANSVSLVDNIKNNTRNYTLGETVRWTTNLKKNFDMNFSATPTYNIANYSVEPDQNANYFSETLSLEPTYFTKSGWIVGSSFDLTSYSGRTAGYNTSVPLWNASLAKQFFKNKAGELKLSVFDLLNQNVSIVRNVTENYIQDVQTKVLTRYVLLTFTYNLRSFGSQQQQQQRRFPPGMRGGGMPPF